MKRLPASFGKFASLTELNLSNNALTTLPESVSQLTQLKILNVANNHLTQLSSSIWSSCTSITQLGLNGNEWTSLPEGLSSLSNLEVIRLGMCRLKEFPKILLELKSLKDIQLNDNELTDFPKNMSLPLLEVLNLSNNQFTSFPYEESSNDKHELDLPSLTKLVLVENKIEFLHPMMSSLTALQTVQISCNKLSSIIPLCEIKSIRSLELSMNRLSTLPDELGDLQQLKGLDLSYNDIADVPSSLSKLTSLEVLSLMGNNLPLDYSIDHLFSNDPKPVIRIEDPLAPNQILPQLYLGPFPAAKNKHNLKRLKITHILTVMNQPPLYPEEFKYHVVNVADMESVNLLQHFDACHKFIDDAIQNSGCLLVHCSAGVSRSSTIVISYIMKTMKMPFSEAYAFVKERRPIVCPNVGFQKQLKQWQKTLGISEPKGDSHKCIIS